MKSVKNLIPNMHGPIGFLSSTFNLCFESTPVDPPTMIPLLAAIFETALSSHCTHEKTNWEYVDRELVKLVPGYTGTSEQDERLLEYLIDPTYTWAIEYLMEMKVDRWECWIVTVGKSGVIILQCLGDYRVLEWERLVREGVVTPPEHIRNSKRPGPIKGHVVASRPRIKEVPKIIVREKDTVSLAGSKPIGYRIHLLGRTIVRTTVAELQELMGNQLTPEIIGKLHTFGLVPNNLYMFEKPGFPPIGVEVLWREDRAFERLALKQAVRAMNLEPEPLPVPRGRVSILDDVVEYPA